MTSIPLHWSSLWALISEAAAAAVVIKREETFLHSHSNEFKLIHEIKQVSTIRN